MDRGVHALNMPLTVDLQASKDGDVFFDPKKMTFALNNKLRKCNIDIEVLKTVAIDGGFQPRMAKSRTYLYRFAVVRHEKLKKYSDLLHNPVEDLPYHSQQRFHPYFSYLPLKDQPYFTEVRVSYLNV